MSYGATTTAAEVAAIHDLTGTWAIVTGGTSGIGAETARVLAAAGAQVTITGRAASRGEATAARLRETTGGDVAFAELDLGSLSSVSRFAAAVCASSRPLHLLVNNAGIMAIPLAYTEDGIESQLATNHLGHFALTIALLGPLAAGGGARVVVLSSRAHRRSDMNFEDPNFRTRPYDRWQAYGQSKTACALFAVGLTRHHAADGITANAVMPGAIHTGLQDHLPSEDLKQLGWVQSGEILVPSPAWKSIPQGAATSVWAALAPELEGIGGRYLEDCAIGMPWTRDNNPPAGFYLPYALDPEHAERLWDLSMQLSHSERAGRHDTAGRPRGSFE